MASLNYSSQSKLNFYLLYAIDVSDMSTEFWLDIDQTMDIQQDVLSSSWQDEQDEPVKSGKAVGNPIYLFGQFVPTVSSDVLKDTKSRSEVSW